MATENAALANAKKIAELFKGAQPTTIKPGDVVLVKLAHDQIEVLKAQKYLEEVAPEIRWIILTPGTEASVLRPEKPKE